MDEYASGDEGTPIPLSISSALVDTDGSETLSIQISGVPANATLNNNGINNGGVWTLTPADLAGLAITVADNATFDLSVVSTATGQRDWFFRYSGSGAADILEDVSADELITEIT